MRTSLPGHKRVNETRVALAPGLLASFGGHTKQSAFAWPLSKARRPGNEARVTYGKCTQDPTYSIRT